MHNNSCARFLMLLALTCVMLLPATVRAQCFGLPSVTALGSNKFPVGLCSPVQANVTYNVTFTSPVPAGKLELIFDWGDGTAQTVVPLATGTKTYNASETHTFPQESNCDYLVTITMRYNDELCTKTNQVQKISSWRTDQFNGGNVSLVSPVTKKDTHEVCEGDNVDVVLEDATNWNCNGENSAETPNNEYRWQQIIYNTPVAGNRIPNVQVDGTLVTGPNGSTIIADYQDPRGVFFMSAPVLVDDNRRRPSLKITAPGGFGANLPKAGDEFAVTLRYWNFCNPYDDPEIPGPPADVMNGDHPPVTKTSFIKIIAPPPALKAVDQMVCRGTTPSAFSVTGVSKGHSVKWYKYVPGSDLPGDLIASKPTLPIASHPSWKNNTTPGVYKVWATQKANDGNAASCESPAILVTRVIKETLTISPDLIAAIPTEVCNGQPFTINFAASLPEAAGGATKYTWAGSAGLTVTSSTPTSVTFMPTIASFDTTLSAMKTITISKQYENAPTCSADQTVNIRVFQAPAGGTLSGTEQVCEKDDVGLITLSGYSGHIDRWEMKKDDASYQAFTGEKTKNQIAPGNLQPGSYTFRAVVKNGSCNEVYSNEKKIIVSVAPPTARAGEDQFICSSLSSSALKANDPAPGVGMWTYVSSVPAGLPTPSFQSNNPNTTVTILAENAGVYNMRWTVSNGSCTTYDDVVVDFGTDPTQPQAGFDKSFCGDTATLAGNIPVKGQGRWSLVSGPCVGPNCSVNILSPTSPNTEVTLGSAPHYGSYTFRWSISSGGNNCFIKTDDVVITFQEPVKISAADITGICIDRNDLSMIELKATTTGPLTNAQWVNVDGHGQVGPSSVIKNGNSATVTSTYKFSAKDYDEGDPIKLKIATVPSSTSCTLSEEVVTISFEKKQIAYAGADIENSCDQDVKLNANAPSSGTGTWATTQPGVTFDDIHDPKTFVRNLPVGKTILTWTILDPNSICQAVTSSLSITHVGRPDAKDVSTAMCAVDSTFTEITLTNYESSITTMVGAERTITWFKNSAPPSGVLITNAAEPLRVGDEQEFIARVQDTRTGCSNDAKLVVNVRRLPALSNTIITQCEDIAGSATATGINLNDHRFAQGVTSESNVSITWHYTQEQAAMGIQPIQESVTVHKHKQFFARVTYNDATACSAVAKVDLLINSVPNIRTIMGRESVCQGQSSVPGNLPVEVYQVTPQQGAKYHWQIPADAKFTVFGGGGEDDFYILLQFPEVYTGKIGVTAERNGCMSGLIEKQITVSAAPVKPEISGDDIVCSNAGTVAFTVTPNNFPSSAYNWDIRRASDNSSGGATIAEGQLTGNILVNIGTEDVIISVRESNSSCVSPVATKVVSVVSPPKAKLVVEKSISSFGSNDGVIKTEVTEGTAPYRSYKLMQTGETNAHGVFDQLSQGSYHVEVTDANGCIATTNIQHLEQPFAEINASFSVTPRAACFPVTIQVQNRSTGADSYQWELYRSSKLVATSNLMSPDFRISEPGDYDLRLSANNAASKMSDEFVLKGIQVFDIPHAAFELRNDVIYAPDTKIELINFSANANQYTWSFGDGTTSTEFEPTHQYQKEGRYLLTLLTGHDYGMIDSNGDGVADQHMVCYDSTQKEVVALQGGELKIPNAFTPNTNGPQGNQVTSGSFNDVFLPVGKGITEFHMLIYDRWGSLIFESKDKNIGWDGYDPQGKLSPAGPYIYKITVRLSDGEKVTRVGDVTVIR